VFADFIPLIVALAVAALIYLLRERHRRRTRIQPARPDLSMSEAWELWQAAADFQFSAASKQQAKNSLLETERALAASGDLRSLRLEILRSATTALYLETILELAEPERAVLLKGYQEGMEPALRSVIEVSNMRWMVLREYGRLKYDDAVPEDWFHQYMEIARPYIGEKVRLAREFLVELDQGAARLAEIYDELLRDLEERLLKSPRKKRFVPPDLRPMALPTAHSAPSGPPPR
jgi:hypothetical protein